MTNEAGICCDCEGEEDCYFHRKQKEIKVFECSGFLLKKSLREAAKVLFEDGEPDGKT